MTDQAIDKLTGFLKDNRDQLTEKNLEKAIELLRLSLAPAREKDLKKWKEVRPSAMVWAAKAGSSDLKRMRLYKARPLREDEYEEYKYMIPEIDDVWFLDSTGKKAESRHYLAEPVNVVKGKRVLTRSARTFAAVRPAIEIALLPEGYVAGDIFIVKGNRFLLLEDDLALCLTPYGGTSYDQWRNNYADSYLRRSINWWFERLVN